MEIYKESLSSEKNYEISSSQKDDGNIHYLISQSTCSDIPTLKFLIDNYFEEQSFSVDPESAYIIICNLRNSILSAEDELYYYVLKLIYLILQNTSNVFEVFEKAEIFDLIGIILSSEDFDEAVVNLSYDILDTCFNSDAFKAETEINIVWAFPIISNLNAKILQAIEGNKDISSPLSLSTCLLEKGVFSVDEMHNIFIFYVKLLEMLNDKDQIDLPYGMLNFSKIMQRFPCFYDEFDGSIYQLLFTSLESNIPSIIQYALEIFLPIIQHNPQLFLDEHFIAKCVDQLQNPNRDFIKIVLKSIISLCSVSEQACTELVESNFFDIRLNFGFEIDSLIFRISAIILNTIALEKELVNDSFFSKTVFNYISTFVNHDDPTLIICCLDIIINVIRILGREFIIDEELFENVSNLVENNHDSQEVSEKALQIVQLINENASAD